jgi:hypothetical protein
MKFSKQFSDEQRFALHEIIREAAIPSDKPSYNFTSEGSLKREAGHFELTIDNFFTTENLSSFRCCDTFCEYLISLDYNDVEPLKKLFELMNDNVAFDVRVHVPGNVLEIFVYYKANVEYEYIDITYHPAFHVFLNEYTTGQLNVKVSAEELVKKIGDFTNYVD